MSTSLTPSDSGQAGSAPVNNQGELLQAQEAWPKTALLADRCSPAPNSWFVPVYNHKEVQQLLLKLSDDNNNHNSLQEALKKKFVIPQLSVRARLPAS